MNTDLFLAILAMDAYNRPGIPQLLPHREKGTG
jgi:hypothetical protein